MSTAYSYVRFSTPEQIKGDSIRRQVELSQNYAEAHCLTLDDSLQLTDLGVSAFNSANAAPYACSSGVDVDYVQKTGMVLIPAPLR